MTRIEIDPIYCCWAAGPSHVTAYVFSRKDEIVVALIPTGMSGQALQYAEMAGHRCVAALGASGRHGLSRSTLLFAPPGSVTVTKFSFLQHRLACRRAPILKCYIIDGVARRPPTR